MIGYIPPAQKQKLTLNPELNTVYISLIHTSVEWGTSSTLQESEGGKKNLTAFQEGLREYFVLFLHSKQQLSGCQRL